MVILQKASAVHSVTFGPGIVSITESDRDTKATTYKIGASVGDKSFSADIDYKQFLEISGAFITNEYNPEVSANYAPILVEID